MVGIRMLQDFIQRTLQDPSDIDTAMMPRNSGSERDGKTVEEDNVEDTDEMEGEFIPDEELEEPAGEKVEEEDEDENVPVEDSNNNDVPSYLRGRTDLVTLWDFDVQVVLKEDLGVEIFEVTDLVTDWMNDSFLQQLSSLGFTSEQGYALFNTVILLERDQRKLRLAEYEQRFEQEVDTTATSGSGSAVGELYTAQYKGGALFSRNATQNALPVNVVLEMQSRTLRQESALLASLQKSDALGLGNNVVDLRTSLNSQNSPSNGNIGNNNNDSLQVVIVIAIVVACVAFFFLVFAIVWAWRYDKRSRQAYMQKPNGSTEESVDDKNLSSPNTANTSAPPSTPNYPKEIVGSSNYYPESVISEDISTALSQYYRSGLAGQAFANNDQKRRGSGVLNDAASISSMESYGYSLDGYAPSLATNTLTGDPTDKEPPAK